MYSTCKPFHTKVWIIIIHEKFRRGFWGAFYFSMFGNRLFWKNNAFFFQKKKKKLSQDAFDYKLFWIWNKLIQTLTHKQHTHVIFWAHETFVLFIEVAIICRWAGDWWLVTLSFRFQILRDLIPHSDQKRDTASFLLEVHRNAESN